jgi:hypothetical protein
MLLFFYPWPTSCKPFNVLQKEWEMSNYRLWHWADEWKQAAQGVMWLFLRFVDVLGFRRGLF